MIIVNKLHLIKDQIFKWIYQINQSIQIQIQN